MCRLSEVSRCHFVCSVESLTSLYHCIWINVSLRNWGVLPPAGRSHYCSGCIREIADSGLREKASTASQLRAGRGLCRAALTDLQILMEFLGCIRELLGEEHIWQPWPRPELMTACLNSTVMRAVCEARPMRCVSGWGSRERQRVWVCEVEEGDEKRNRPGDIWLKFDFFP